MAALLVGSCIALQVNVGFGDTVTPVVATFERRKLALPDDWSVGLSDVFSGDLVKQTQGAAFLRNGAGPAFRGDRETARRLGEAGGHKSPTTRLGPSRVWAPSQSVCVADVMTMLGIGVHSPGSRNSGIAVQGAPAMALTFAVPLVTEPNTA